MLHKLQNIIFKLPQFKKQIIEKSMNCPGNIRRFYKGYRDRPWHFECRLNDRSAYKLAKS